MQSLIASVSPSELTYATRLFVVPRSMPRDRTRARQKSAEATSRVLSVVRVLLLLQSQRLHEEASVVRSRASAPLAAVNLLSKARRKLRFRGDRALHTRTKRPPRPSVGSRASPKPHDAPPSIRSRGPQLVAVTRHRAARQCLREGRLECANARSPRQHDQRLRSASRGSAGMVVALHITHTFFAVDHQVEVLSEPERLKDFAYHMPGFAPPQPSLFGFET